MSEAKKEIREGKFFAVISYISFLCIISLLLKKENKFAVFHAKQGLVLFVAEVAVFLLSIIPLLGQFINIAGGVLLVILSLAGVLFSLQEKYGKLPLISKVAENIVL
jgi:uncharacterized membrane protein